ncbi:hypothetical protein B1202_08095 [Acinetobacter amyesii]|uniref:Lysozyme inhibitor LprI-like N-terminal domain-containing protein n=1 Tax=Acinetobacter amyesii TaxID=2942470 RepID=A0A1T1H1D3_9GAMM|nr:hypothetical protein B1202_08095 [Acinetobacter amyesii]
MSIFWCFSALGILSCCIVYAGEYQTKCISDSTQHNEILACYMEEFEQADQKLNQIYQVKIYSLSAIKANALRESQRHWLHLKEQACIADEQNYGRESHFDAMQCEIDWVSERILFLEKQ